MSLVLFIFKLHRLFIAVKQNTVTNLFVLLDFYIMGTSGNSFHRPTALPPRTRRQIYFMNII